MEGNVVLTTWRNDRMGSDYLWITRIVAFLTYIPPICLGMMDMALSPTLNLVCVRICGMQSLIYWKHFFCTCSEMPTVYVLGHVTQICAA